MGERALRVSLPDVDTVLALHGVLTRQPLAGQIDLVPGAGSLLIQLAGPASAELVRETAERVREQLAHGSASGRPGSLSDDGPPPTVTIETVYQGLDLDRVIELTGLSADGVIAAHTAHPWRVAFCGFAPGFAYLSGGDPHLSVPRRDTPRREVPAGAVGLAGAYSGIYPRSSPGGWQLIGRTDAPLWDARRDPPALLRPGMSVTFRAVRPSTTLRQVRSAPAQREPDHSGTLLTLTALRAGLRCLVQDLGRPGYADMGVGRSGAADRGALRRANGAAGNATDAAALEILLGGAEFRADGELTVALAGAPVEVSVATAPPDDMDESDDAVRSDDATRPTGGAAPTTADPPGRADRPAAESYHRVPHPMERPLTLPAGARIRLGRPAVGLRTYLAVRGGIDVPPVLGSRSTDLLAGLGPTPIRAGEVLPVGTAEPGVAARDPGRAAPGTEHPAASAPRATVDAVGVDGGALAILPGPQWDWFTVEAWELLRTASWSVLPASNRVAARLAGPELTRTTAAELPSQGLVRGAVQVPPSGELVAFLADHPVTGGYPVIAVLTDAAADRLAQCRPGAVVRLRDAALP